MTGLLASAAAAVLALLLPGTGTRRKPRGRHAAPRAAETPPPEPAQRRRPRSPYAREAAEARTVDVSHLPPTRPYYRRAIETAESGPVPADSPTNDVRHADHPSSFRTDLCSSS
ncbi:hypothetical protein GCM10010431_47730 [Streptomyces kunmingensis]